MFLESTGRSWSTPQRTPPQAGVHVQAPLALHCPLYEQSPGPVHGQSTTAESACGEGSGIQIGSVLQKHWFV
jgi:hypothetical protein